MVILMTIIIVMVIFMGKSWKSNLIMVGYGDLSWNGRGIIMGIIHKICNQLDMCHGQVTGMHGGFNQL